MSLVSCDPPTDEVNVVCVVEDGQAQIRSEHLYEANSSSLKSFFYLTEETSSMLVSMAKLLF